MRVLRISEREGRWPIRQVRGRGPGWVRLMGLMLLMLACGRGDGQADEDPAVERTTLEEGLDAAVDGAEASAAAQAATTIVIALRQLPDGLDPLGDLTTWGRRVADDLVFEGLVRRQKRGAPWVDMALADRCEVERDQIVDCHVRRGVRFHDGTELTIEDVTYSLSYWLDPRRAWIKQRHGLTNMKQVEVVDGPRRSSERDEGQWVRITFGKPEPLALERLSAVKVVPLKKHRGRAARFARDPVGTGPMRVTTLEQDRVVLERVEPIDWAREDRPLPPTQRVVLRAVNDGAEALTLLRRGQVHVLPEVAPNHVPIELGKPGMAARFQAWLRSPARYDVLLWNVGQGLMKNDGLREALHIAVPRAGVVQRAHAAAGLDLGAPVDLHDPQPIDLDALVDATADDVGKAGLPAGLDPLGDVQGRVAARALLDGLGWKLERGIRRKPAGNLRVTITWDGATGPGSTSAAQVREAWQELGVQAPYAMAPWGYLLTLIKRGEFQVALLQLADHDDADLYSAYHSRGDLNVAGVADRELDAALEAFRAAADPEERSRAEHRIADRLARLRVATVLYAPAPLLLASKRVEGIEWIDDLPVLDRLVLRAADEGGEWARP